MIRPSGIHDHDRPFFGLWVELGLSHLINQNIISIMFKQTLIKMGFNFAKDFAQERIESENVENTALSLIETSEQVTLALVDENKKNGDQIKEVLKVQASKISAPIFGLATEATEKLENENVKAAAAVLFAASQETIEALTDDNPANSVQIQEIILKHFPQLLENFS